MEFVGCGLGYAYGVCRLYGGRLGWNMAFVGQAGRDTYLCAMTYTMEAFKDSFTAYVPLGPADVGYSTC